MHPISIGQSSAVRPLWPNQTRSVSSCLRVIHCHPPPLHHNGCGRGKGGPWIATSPAAPRNDERGMVGLGCQPIGLLHPHRHPGHRAGVHRPLAPRWKNSVAPDQVRGDVGGEWGHAALSRLRACPGTDPSTRHCEWSEAIQGLRVRPLTSVVVETKGGPWIATSPDGSSQ